MDAKELHDIAGPVMNDARNLCLRNDTVLRALNEAYELGRSSLLAAVESSPDEVVRELNRHYEQWGSPKSRDEGVNEVVMAFDCHRAAAHILALRAELERERMRLAACGVVAMANTPGSAANARQMHPDYRSASLSDVERAVDAEMSLRAELASVKGDLDGLLTVIHSASLDRDGKAQPFIQSRSGSMINVAACLDAYRAAHPKE